MGQSSLPPEERAQAHAEIRAHHETHGSKDWEQILDKWSRKVARRTIWRWIQEVKTGKGPTRAEVKAKAVAASRAAMLKIDLPVAPSPAVMAKLGGYAGVQINWIAAANQLFFDALMMREQGVKRDDDGVETIRNMMFFDGSIKRRLEVIQTNLKIQSEIYDLQRMEVFYQEIIAIIVEEIGPADPELRNRVMNRIRIMNEREMMTPHVSTNG